MTKYILSTAFKAALALPLFAISLIAYGEENDPPPPPPKEPGLAGVTIYLDLNNNSESTTTNDNGEFWFENLESGTKRLRIGRSEFAKYPPAPTQITLMSLPTPEDASRKFTELQPQLIKRIPAHTPEWTDLEPSDPGQTMIGTAAAASAGDANLDGDIGTNETLGDAEHDKWIIIELVGSDEGDDQEGTPEATTSDSFFDIFIKVGEDFVKGRVSYSGVIESAPPEIPEIPDRPEKIELPDAPIRPNG
jgi:hypothetical protein